MQTRTIWEKLKSTKLWCALAGLILGAALALGADGESLGQVLGAVTAIVEWPVSAFLASTSARVASAGRLESLRTKPALVALTRRTMAASFSTLCEP